MGNIFQFKQFSVDQKNCAMRINTDGVLLGAMTTFQDPEYILDVGTGTGVISLMLAQRFTEAKLWGVEIDQLAAQTAKENFVNSPYKERLTLIHSDIFHFKTEQMFDLIVSNPPFYLNTLHNPDPRKKIAKHTDDVFFKGLLNFANNHLTKQGVFQIIVSNELLDLLIEESKKNDLYITAKTDIRSFDDSEVIRYILCFERTKKEMSLNEFIIYQHRAVYSEEYKTLLQPYFLAY